MSVPLKQPSFPIFRGLGILLLITAGCQSQSPKTPPPPLALPAMQTRAGYYTGTPLSGPRPTVATVASPQDALDVQVKLVALDQLPKGTFDPLGGKCRLIVARIGADPVLPSAQMTQGVLLADAAAASNLRTALDSPPTIHLNSLATLTGVLPVNVTATFDADEQRPANSPNHTPQHRIEIRTYRAPTTAPAGPVPLQIALTLEEFQPVSSVTSQPTQAACELTVLRSETAVLDRSADAAHDSLVFLVPARFTDSPTSVIAAVVDISPASATPQHADAVAQCRSTLTLSAAVASGRSDITPIEGSQSAGFDSALRALAQPADRRGALVYLAGQTEAHICADTSLVAADGFLDKLSKSISQKLTAIKPPLTAPVLGWVLDQSTFELLSALKSDKDGANMPPELGAVLTLYAGEAGRHGSSLDEIVRHLTSRQDLENHLVAENLVFLTDASPASRVRANDWLRSRNSAPPGYDPLGPIKQRRDALDKMMTAQATTRPTVP